MLRPYSKDGSVNLVDPWIIFNRDSRVVTIFTPIMSSQEILVIEGSHPVSIAEQIYGSLISLGLENNRPVKIVINSPGGDIIAGFIIIQAIEHLKAKGTEVWTLNLVEAKSMAGIILMSGTKGKRYALGDTTTHTHFGQRTAGGRTHDDVQESMKFIERIDERLFQLISTNSLIPEYYVSEFAAKTGISPDPDKVRTDDKLRLTIVRQFLSMNKFMDPEEAKKAGIIDHVLLPGDPMIDTIFRGGENSRGEGQ